MKVKRIVRNVHTTEMTKAKSFYCDLLGLEPLMDLGWILTCGNNETAPPQISFAAEGGSGTAVPDLSVEVDDLEEALARAKRLGFPPEYGPVTEPWGVRRFYVRDPFGQLVNIVAHG